MKLADKLKQDLNFNEIVNKLHSELKLDNSVFIPSHLAEGNIQRLRNEGFKVNDDGYQRNGGVYVSFKGQKSQWEQRG